MPRLSDVEHSSLLGPTGQVIGAIDHVLFHPREPRVVGVQVRPSRMLYVIDRKPVFVPLGHLTFTEEGIVASGKRPETNRPLAEDGSKAEYTWDETVIWRAMPARTDNGRTLGAVHDAGFTKKRGRVTWIEVSEGAMNDAAVGRTRFEGELACGFDGAAVVVARPVEQEIRGSGGLAKAAGTGAAVLTVRGGAMAEKALRHGGAAAGAVVRSLKPGGKTRKAIDRACDAANRWLDDEDE